ncbi:carboxypeptidase-like regulatory domain-containing protein [Flavobacterium sp. UW10123]|uniref:carboxypeptidase-like regulatory domain-containing protein n=1 Tax=Flavobacterium sp. UW10123 TaxID=3230800 RepID=UPI003399891A
MKTSKTISAVFFLFFVQNNFGQTEVKRLYGRVTEMSNPVEGVNVINSNAEVAVITDAQGNFAIDVSEGEVLLFSSVGLNSVKRQITSDDMRSELLSIKMNAEEVALKEVIVNDNTAITAENLGIIPRGQKKYTQAERQLATAGDFKPVMLLGLLGGSMQLDPLINKINGRTKRLKANVEIEKKEKNFERLGYLFDEVYFVERLNISKENVNEFKFYAIENESFCAAMNSKNKTSTEFLLGELAVKYKEIITGENK